MTTLADDLAAIGWTPAGLARQAGCAAQVADRWVKDPDSAPPLLVAWVAELADAHRQRPRPDWRRPRGARAAVDAPVAETPG